MWLSRQSLLRATTFFFNLSWNRAVATRESQISAVSLSPMKQMSVGLLYDNQNKAKHCVCEAAPWSVAWIFVCYAWFRNEEERLCVQTGQIHRGLAPGKTHSLQWKAGMTIALLTVTTRSFAMLLTSVSVLLLVCTNSLTLSLFHRRQPSHFHSRHISTESFGWVYGALSSISHFLNSTRVP